MESNKKYLIDFFQDLIEDIRIFRCSEELLSIATT